MAKVKLPSECGYAFKKWQNKQTMVNYLGSCDHDCHSIIKFDHFLSRISKYYCDDETLVSKIHIFTQINKNPNQLPVHLKINSR